MPNPSILHDPLAKIESAETKPAPAADADQGPVRVDAVRITFYDEVQERCFVFAKDLLTLIPELESVAVVPVYAKTTEDTPAAILVGREGPPKTASEVMHMSAQMHRAQQHLMRHAAEFLQFVDRELAESIRQLHAKREELEQLDAQSEQQTVTPEQPAAGGVAPGGAGPGRDPSVGPPADR
jgi:hypothetical protein